MSWRFWVIKLRPTIKCMILCQTDELLLNTLLTKLHKSGTLNDWTAPVKVGGCSATCWRKQRKAIAELSAFTTRKHFQKSSSLHSSSLYFMCSYTGRTTGVFSFHNLSPFSATERKKSPKVHVYIWLYIDWKPFRKSKKHFKNEQVG